MSNLETLANAWRKAKRAENEARAKRVAVEQQIIDATGCREEGSQTHEAGPYKITVTGKLNRTLDQAAWEQIAPQIPEQMRPVSYAPKLDVKGLRYLQNNEPETFRLIAPAITTKPGKPAVSIKE